MSKCTDIEKHVHIELKYLKHPELIYLKEKYKCPICKEKVVSVNMDSIHICIMCG